MVLTRTDENELLTALYSAIFQQNGPWQLFLSRLRARMEADICHLHIRAAGSAEWRLVDIVRVRGAEGEALDPAMPAFEDLRGGRVYAGAELPGERVGERHLRVSWPDGGDMALSIFRSKGDFRARDVSLLASLSPHLTLALRSRMEVERERRRSELAEGLLSRFATGWLLLDGRGRILDGDAVAMCFLEEGRVMHRAADGHIRFPYAEAEQLLDEVMAERDMGQEPRAAWLSVDPPIQMVMMRPPGEQPEALATPHCLLVLRHMQEGALGHGRYLPKLFRLSRSEAALAAKMAEGASLTEAAEALGLTIETARNYSKRIYVKTGARGQAEVVRIVLDGVSLVG